MIGTNHGGNDTGDGLLSLAERCEAATGPDRKLDAKIAAAVGLPCGPDSGWSNSDNGDYWTVDECAADYTASLDAAMTLVPEGWSATVVRVPGHPAEAGVLEWRVDDKGKHWRPATGADSGKCKAATPALALCAAALRARAA